MASGGAGGTEPASATAAPPAPPAGAVVVASNAAAYEAAAAAAAAAGKMLATFFWAAFHAPSAPGGQMDKVFAQLALMHKDALFVKVEAEQVPEVAERYEVTVVPTFVFTKGGTVVGSLQGANAPELSKRLAAAKAAAAKITAAAPAPAGGAAGVGGAEEPMEDKLRRLTRSSHVMLFMKGTPEAPRCKFSRKMVELLTAEGVQFGSFDILGDPAVRAAIKEWANWPTFPMLWVGGELKGGVDVVTELKEDEGSLASLLPPADKAVPLDDRLRALVGRSKVMLFMKGEPDAPRCGFSRRMVALLRDHKVGFDSFDILSDNAVREGLKTLFNWPTFPQLYVDGKLVGGLDVITEMAEDDSAPLPEQLGVPAVESLDDRLRKMVASSRVMLVMKGTADAPRCGFSRQAVTLLNEVGIKFGTFDILADEEARARLKTLFNWPTFPQLYVDGALVGGLDVMKEMHEEGELEAFKEAA